MGRRIAVIGAGASGVTAIKTCIDEGLEVVCFERTDSIGGLWHFTKHSKDEEACVMKSTVINTSKEMMCYSDFPIPKEFPLFMHNKRVLEYFHMYCDHFDLKKHVRFETEILVVSKNSDFDTTGKWKLEVKDRKTEKVSTEIFDGLLICTGHHAEKNFPKFPGQDEFTGSIVHTHDYKDHVGYENKTVVVLGIGNSGGDVAVELARIAEHVYLSTRRGSWVTYRIADNGIPGDMLVTRRYFNAIISSLPKSTANWMAEKKLNARFDHSDYGLRPQHRFLNQHPTVNDDLPNRIACGSVIMKSNIKKFTKTGIEFDDGSVIEKVDAVVMATGYLFGFPFLEKGIIEVKDNVVDLYKYAFPPDLEPSTLAVIGCIQPWGAIMPISELQCRWAARVFKGDTKLPSKETMWKDINMKKTEMCNRYVTSKRHTIQVDWIPFMDEVAEHIGCRPNIGKLLMTDPALAMTVCFGPCTPYQYRLHGPGMWKGAKEAIQTQWDRTWYPFQTRQAYKPPNNNGTFVVLMEILIVIIFAIIVMRVFW